MEPWKKTVASGTERGDRREGQQKERVGSPLSFPRTATRKRHLTLVLASSKGRGDLSWGRPAGVWSCCRGWLVMVASVLQTWTCWACTHTANVGIRTSTCKGWTVCTVSQINYIPICVSNGLNVCILSAVTWRVIFWSLILNPNTKTWRALC